MHAFRIIVEKSIWDDDDWKNSEVKLDVIGFFRDWDNVLVFIERWVSGSEFVEDDDDYYLWGWVEFGDERFDFYVYMVESSNGLNPEDIGVMINDVIFG